MRDPVNRPGWASLQQFTAARIALGRTGASLPTEELLRFQLAHAQARDAVGSTLDTARLIAELTVMGKEGVSLSSAATDRRTYLVRPDFGRKLGKSSQQTLMATPSGWDVVFVVADGLSATAVNRHALPLLSAVLPLLTEHNWSVAPIALVEQGRVAIGDEVAAQFKAEFAVVLIGERPGLSSPDSLGVYITYRPNPGVTNDAERNCLSNIRPEGLTYPVAAAKLFYLLTEGRRRQLTGIELKDETAPDGLPQVPSNLAKKSE